MMSIDEIKALMSAEVEEGAEDNRIDNVYSEISERDDKIGSLEEKVIELTNKVSEMAETNSKLAEQLAYVEPEKVEENDDEPVVEFADFSNIYEED